MWFIQDLRAGEHPRYWAKDARFRQIKREGVRFWATEEEADQYLASLIDRGETSSCGFVSVEEFSEK